MLKLIKKISFLLLLMLALCQVGCKKNPEAKESGGDSALSLIETVDSINAEDGDGIVADKENAEADPEAKQSSGDRTERAGLAKAGGATEAAGSEDSADLAGKQTGTTESTETTGPTGATGPTETTDTSKTGDSQEPGVARKGFYVEGTILYDGKGNPFIMRGVNHAHTWYKNQRDIALEAIAETGSNTVRIVLSDGQQWQKDDDVSVKAIIEKCKKLKLIAVLEVHDITGNNSLEALDKTVDYWIGLKDALIGNEPYAIINIANEWYGDWNSDIWAKGYMAAIPKLREAGLTHTILVDSAGWGQYPKSITDRGLDIFEADPLKNTMFAIHMYEYAGRDEKIIKANIDNVLALDLCLIIGEFGQKHTGGDVDEGYILKYCEEVGIGYLGWSWKGNSGGVEYLDISRDWRGTRLSSDWGEILINSEHGIRNTSKICSIYE